MTQDWQAAARAAYQQDLDTAAAQRAARAEEDAQELYLILRDRFGIEVEPTAYPIAAGGLLIRLYHFDSPSPAVGVQVGTRCTSCANTIDWVFVHNLSDIGRALTKAESAKCMACALRTQLPDDTATTLRQALRAFLGEEGGAL